MWAPRLCITSTWLHKTYTHHHVCISNKYKSPVNNCFCCHVCAAESDCIHSRCHQPDYRRGTQVWRQVQCLLHAQKWVWEVEQPPAPLRRKVWVCHLDLVYSWATSGVWNFRLCFPVNKKIEKEVEEYEATYRGRELPGFINYRTFETMVKEQIKQLEEPAVKKLKDVGGKWLYELHIHPVAAFTISNKFPFFKAAVSSCFPISSRCC